MSRITAHYTRDILHKCKYWCIFLKNTIIRYDEAQRIVLRICIMYLTFRRFSLKVEDRKFTGWRKCVVFFNVCFYDEDVEGAFWPAAGSWGEAAAWPAASTRDTAAARTSCSITPEEGLGNERDTRDCSSRCATDNWKRCPRPATLASFSPSWSS